MKPLTHGILLAALCAGAAPAQTALDDTLYALRDTVAPGICDPPSGPVVAHGLTDGTVFLVPCRMSVADQIHIAFRQMGDTDPQPLHFAQPDVVPGTTALGGQDWTRPEHRGMGVGMMLSSPVVHPETGLIRTHNRLPPGIGEGVVSYTHVLTGEGTRLTGGQIRIGAETHALWPPAPPRPVDEIPLGFDMTGFGVIDAPDTRAEDPADLLVGLGFALPSEDEGHPTRRVEMAQRGDQIAAQVIDGGYADDSVDGAVYRALMQRGPGGWRITELGRVWICGRGTDRYSTSGCP